jgi:hypothetical protein
VLSFMESIPSFASALAASQQQDGRLIRGGSRFKLTPKPISHPRGHYWWSNSVLLM